jgi:hypothetical protein
LGTPRGYQPPPQQHQQQQQQKQQRPVPSTPNKTPTPQQERATPSSRPPSNQGSRSISRM